MSLPEPPVNVKLVMNNGDIVPVDTLYQGVHDGEHHWAVVNPPPAALVKGMQIDKLPPRTSVTLLMSPKPGGGL